MEKDKPRLARLTAIITQLQAGRVVTARELAEKHRVSIRTLYRDIRTLEASGIPIVTEEGKGYSLLDGYKLPPVMFTEEEANALITAEHLVARDKDESLIHQYHAAIVKIKAVMRHLEKEKADLLAERIQIRNNPTGEKTSAYLMRLQKAITNREEMAMQYHSLEGKYSHRHIEPFAIFSTQGNWILIAYCKTRSDFRAFRLDRMIQLDPTGEHFSPHNMTLDQYFEKCREKYYTPDIPMTQGAASFASKPKNKNMQVVEVAAFKVIGISVRTTNADGKGATDIGALWNRFLSEGIMQQIPNKEGMDIYSLYTDYESDQWGAYTTVLGCKVSSTDEVPDGMTALEVPGGSYQKTTVKGDLEQGIVVNEWKRIWEADMDRVFATDYEVYGEKAQNPKDAEVEVFVGVK